jgi:hypothetical protein
MPSSSCSPTKFTSITAAAARAAPATASRTLPSLARLRASQVVPAAHSAPTMASWFEQLAWRPADRAYAGILEALTRERTALLEQGHRTIARGP